MHEGPNSPCSLHPTPPTHLSPRLRSVKIEQGKLNDQANTLADLAKVSRAGWGGAALQARRGCSGPYRRRGGPPPARRGAVVQPVRQTADAGQGCEADGDQPRGHTGPVCKGLEVPNIRGALAIYLHIDHFLPLAALLLKK